MRLIHTLRLNGALDLLFCARTTCEKEIFVFRWRSKQGVGSICLYFLFSVNRSKQCMRAQCVSTSFQCEQVQAGYEVNMSLLPFSVNKSKQCAGSMCLYFPSVWTSPSSVWGQFVSTSLQCEQVQAVCGVNMSVLPFSVNRSKQGMGSICHYFSSVLTGLSRDVDSNCLYFPSVWTGPSRVWAQAVFTSIQYEHVWAGYAVKLSLCFSSVWICLKMVLKKWPGVDYWPTHPQWRY